MTKNKEFVKFDNVDKSYDGKILVVKGLNLDIEEGEFVTMLGPSGSGKTTCLMMLAGFETPTHGEIYLEFSKKLAQHHLQFVQVLQHLFQPVMPHLSYS